MRLNIKKGPGVNPMIQNLRTSVLWVVLFVWAFRKVRLVSLTCPWQLRASRNCSLPVSVTLTCPPVLYLSGAAFRFHLLQPFGLLIFSSSLPFCITQPPSHVLYFNHLHLLLVLISVSLQRETEFFHPARWKKARLSCMVCVWLESHCVCWLMSGSVCVCCVCVNVSLFHFSSSLENRTE